MENIKLNVPLLREKVPNLTSAARKAGLRPATVSNLCTGKISLARAEVKTLVALADLAGCPVDELILRGSEGKMIETGIKALDLFAPLVGGGTIGIVARPGMGQLVALSEIFHRMKKRGYTTVLIEPEQESPGIEDVVQEAMHTCKTMDDAYELIKNLGADENVLLAADRSTVLNGDLYQLQDDLQSAGLMNVTTFLVDPRGEAVDEIEPFGPLDTLWQFDAELISRGVYPAIQPLVSTSTLLEEASKVESEHIAVQRKARKILRRYRELRFLVSARGMDHFPEAEQDIYRKGERLEAYLSQPFYVAEPFTNIPGSDVPLSTTLQDVSKIIEGAEADRVPADLMFKGSLTEI